MIQYNLVFFLHMIDLWKLLEKGKINKIKALFENEPYLKEICNYNDLNLYKYAAWKNNQTAILQLIAKKFDLSDLEIARAAVSNGSIDVLKLLFEKGICKVNDKNSYGSTLLHKAVDTQQVESTRFLLQQDGIDVNAKDEYNSSPLAECMLKKEEEAMVLQMLLERNDIDLSGTESMLHWACSNNHLEVVKLLIQKHGQ